MSAPRSPGIVGVFATVLGIPTQVLMLAQQARSPLSSLLGHPPSPPKATFNEERYFRFMALVSGHLALLLWAGGDSPSW